MPPRRKKPKAIPTGLRRKCHGTGRVLNVVCRYIKIPEGFEAKSKKSITDYEQIPGVYIENYSSYEVAEQIRGKDSFTNTYTEDDFIRP
jgi:hypothetical protein|tara:strand:+ start:390 stop:656 length:267 start_codon:yes stop_codon:yes gene_type:complete